MLSMETPPLLPDSQDHSADLRQFFNDVGRPIDLPDGKVLFEQGSPGTTLFLLDEGVIDISVLSHEGRRLALNKVVAGELLGEISFFANGFRSATAVARGPSRTLSVDRKSFYREIAGNQNVAAALFKHLAMRLAWLSEQQIEPILYGVDARLARRLLYLAGRSRSGSDVVELTQTELAENLGVSREKVARVLSGWRAKGWIETKRACIIVVDRAPLLSLCSHST